MVIVVALCIVTVRIKLVVVVNGMVMVELTSSDVWWMAAELVGLHNDK